MTSRKEEAAAIAAVVAWVNDPKNEQAIRDALAVCDGDGHSIVLPEAFPSLVGSGIIERLTMTFESDGTLKGSITKDGRPVDKVEGIYTLHVQESIRDWLGLPSSGMNGRGFRARAATSTIIAHFDARQVDELVGASDPMAEPDTSRDGEPLAETATMNLTPTPDEYRRLLTMVRLRSHSIDDREWAQREFDRVKDVVAWGSQS